MKRSYLYYFVMMAVAAFISSCSAPKTPEPFSNLVKKDFQTTIDGKQTDLYIIKNQNGLSAAITNYGAKVVGLLVPDKNGKPGDVILGFASLDKYEKADCKFHGGIIGRYGNRIAKGKFTLEGKEYTLAKNNFPNHLHGGPGGFFAKVWDAKLIGDSSITFSYTSKDGEEGYPGNLAVDVTYTLTADNSLKIEYNASTDKTTVVNLTNHSFFNLAADSMGLINDHILTINANEFTPVDSTLIPDGKLAKVEGTPFDFRAGKAIGADITKDDVQLKYGSGFDHNFVLALDSTKAINFAAKVVDPKSGRVMEVYTTEPGIQFYGGNFMNGKDIDKNGKPHNYREALCLETQHFPDSPNQPAFPTTTLKAGEKYHTLTLYKFSVQK
jgi:aldose 1-epimerase